MRGRLSSRSVHRSEQLRDVSVLESLRGMESDQDSQIVCFRVQAQSEHELDKEQSEQQVVG